MDDDDCFMVTPVTWSLMLDYERADAIAQLCRQLSFFFADKLILTEREEVLCSFGTECQTMNSLLIHGSIGNARKDAFLRILRLARLTLVRDIASHVVVSPQIGDVLPSAMIYPLWETRQVKSFQRWNSLYWAMRCGILRKLKRRREMMESHVNQILNMKPAKEKLNSDDGKKRLESSPEGAFYNAFRDLLELEQDEQNAAIDLYHNACTEERVNLAFTVANVPTLIVAWATWDTTSLDWLTKHLFNAEKIEEHVEIVGSTSTTSSTVDSDPWLQAVRQFVHVPQQTKLFRKGKTHRYAKRAQLVLINVDREKDVASCVLNSLVEKISGWTSPEVFLIPLWCGSEGLQSNLATDLNISSLPFFIATHIPAVQNRKFGDGIYPRICFITPQHEEGAHDVIAAGQNTLTGVFGSNVVLEDWHAVEKNERDRLTSGILRFMACRDAPLRFCTRVDRSYQNIRSQVVVPAKLLRTQTMSFVSISGTILIDDLLQLKEELHILSRVKNVFFDVKVIQPSSSLLTQLNPLTPTKYIHGSARNITCSECHVDVLIEKEHHFRCIHCGQEDGVVCSRCFLDGKHQQHHILLRVITGAPTTLNLLWGPSNVAPLARFCETLIPNVNDVHIGIYCNSCSKLIYGIRWKCAMCYQYDLCSSCDKKKNQQNAFKSNKNVSLSKECVRSCAATSSSLSTCHTEDHLFLCIPHGCGTHGDECLKPVIVQGDLGTLIGGDLIGYVNK